MSRSKREMGRAAGVLGGATLLSRIMGLLREVVIAYLFGAGMATDAFFVAFRIPNLFRRFLAEGSLTVALIPVFSEYQASRGEEEARKMVHSLFSVALVFLLLFVLIGILGSPWLIRIFAPGFISDPVKFDLTVFLNRVMFGYLFFVSLMALAMGVLNSLDHFASPALSPVLLNLSMIGIPLLFYTLFDPPILSLAIAVLIGGLLQLSIQIPPLEKRGYGFRWRWDVKHPAVQKVFRLMGPSIFGTAVYQLNILITTFLASWLEEGSVSYLWYSGRLFEMVQGIFVISLATAALPTFSRKAVDKDHRGMSEALLFSLKMVLWVTIPSTVGLILLSHPIVTVLFERGLFTSAMSEKTASALFAYALGLAPLGAVRMMVQVFYAYQDMKTPVRIAFYTLLVNFGLALLFMKPLQHTGLALATSLSVVFQALLLTHALFKKHSMTVWGPLRAGLGKILLFACGMGGVVEVVSWSLPVSNVWGLLGTILVGVLVFCGLNWIAHSEELYEIRRYLLRKSE